tara:strand:+ start:10052 stop:10240 length:189 start_codon:yes stop_codon:yes gene_type:complete
LNFDKSAAQKNGAEKVKIDEVSSAWLLPKEDGSRKMVAYLKNNKVVWVHPNYEAEQNKKQKN